MSRQDEVRSLLVQRIADFADNLFEYSDNEQAIYDELDRFLEFFCGALQAAERDGRNTVLYLSNN